MDILKIIGNNIRSFRTGLSLSQEQLAEKAGLHRTYIGAVERSEKNISAKNIAKIANVLEVPPHKILDPNSQVKNE